MVCSDVLALAWGQRLCQAKPSQAGPDLWPETAFGLAWILSKLELAAWATAWKAGSKIVRDVLKLRFNFFFFLALYSWKLKKKSPTYPNTASLSHSGTHADNELFINLELDNIFVICSACWKLWYTCDIADKPWPRPKPGQARPTFWLLAWPGILQSPSHLKPGQAEAGTSLMVWWWAWSCSRSSSCSWKLKLLLEIPLHISISYS